MDIFWTHHFIRGKNPNVSKVWTYYGHIFCFGHVLDTLWTPFGHIWGLDTFWTHYGHILDTYQE